MSKKCGPCRLFPMDGRHHSSVGVCGPTNTVSVDTSLMSTPDSASVTFHRRPSLRSLARSDAFHS